MKLNARRGAFFAILASVLMFAMNLGDLWNGLQSEHWPQTEGVIQSAAIIRSSTGKGGHTDDARVSYSYQVDGQKFLGDQFAFGAIDWFGTQNQAILARYPVGKKVQVYYSPNNSQLAVLETGIVGETWFIFGFCISFILAGTMILLFYKR
jgi:hypothetical protein